MVMVSSIKIHDNAINVVILDISKETVPNQETMNLVMVRSEKILDNATNVERRDISKETVPNQETMNLNAIHVEDWVISPENALKRRNKNQQEAALVVLKLRLLFATTAPRLATLLVNALMSESSEKMVVDHHVAVETIGESRNAISATWRVILPVIVRSKRRSVTPVTSPATSSEIVPKEAQPRQPRHAIHVEKKVT